jgi:hypothetical protein
MLLRGFVVFLVACAALWGVTHWLCHADDVTLKQAAILTFKVILCTVAGAVVCFAFVYLF